MATGREFAWMVAGTLAVLLTGCAGFFPPLTTTTASGSGTPAGGDFVYVANATVASGSSPTVAAFAVSTSTAGVGTLASVTGSPFGLPLTPTAIAVTPKNTFLYAGGIGAIYVYSINSTTGALTSANGGNAVAVSAYPPESMDISPDGQWLFALSSDGLTLQEYEIDASTGGLTVVANAGYSGLGGASLPRMVRVSPTGAYVALALGTGGVIVCPFTTSTGALSVTSQNALNGQQVPAPTNSSDNALAIDANTAFLYIAQSGSASGVAVYSLGAGGSMTSIKGSPFAAGQGPYGVALDGTGKYVYVANRTDGTVSGFSIGTGGVLTALAGSPYLSGIGATSLAADNSGKYLFAAAGGGTPDLTMYGFDATTAGKLDKVATATTGTDPTGAFSVIATH